MTIYEDPIGSGEYMTDLPVLPALTTWATVEDVDTLTGYTVTERHRRIAVGVIESNVGLFESVPRPDISDRDREWLKRAVCYEAAFVADNPDLFSRLDVTSASQDGESANFRNPDAHFLAPLARKAIRRLSWRGLRPLAPGGGAYGVNRRDVNSEAFDDALPWRPL